MKTLSLMFVALFISMLPTLVSAASLTETLASEKGLNTASPNMMAKYKLGSLVTKGKVHVATAKYDFAVQGGAIGTVNLVGGNGKPVVLPNKAIVVDCIIDVVTPATTSASGTIALSTGQGAADLKAALAAASYTGRVACVPVGTAATAIKLTADRTMTATIATGAITAGKFGVIVQYVMGE